MTIPPSQDSSIHKLPGTGASDVVSPENSKVASASSRFPIASRSRWTYIDLLWSTGSVSLATAIAWVMYDLLGYRESSDLSNLVMVYLLGVVFVAMRLGRVPAVLASVVSIAAFDFFFVPPFYTFAVRESEYLITFAVMLIVAISITTVTDRVRAKAEMALRRERRNAVLLGLSRELGGIRGIEAIGKSAAEQIAEVFDAEVIVLVPGEDRRLVIRGSRTINFSIGPKELNDAQQLFDQTGTESRVAATIEPLYLALNAPRGTVGILAIRPHPQSRLRDPEQLPLLDAFANLVAAAVERANLAEEARIAWERVEAEFLRNTLLSSVSHDLRTPLAAICGAAEALTQENSNLDMAGRRELAEMVLVESQRIERVINNLLDMTRLESGGLRLNREWQPLAEVVGAALHHVDRRLQGRIVTAEIPETLPLVFIDAVSMEQVLVNLLDNAAQYTPPGSPIEITARANDGGVVLELSDRGPGLPSGREDRVFQKFYRSHSGGGSRGIGLGLAICRGIVDAHGGQISAENRSGGGALFRVMLPVRGVPPTVNAVE